MATRTIKATDATELLKEDHAKVRKLLGELEKTTARGKGKRSELIAKIATEIRVHARIEEEIFYPAYHSAAESQEDAKLFFEAEEEHSLVHHFLPIVESTDPGSEEFGARAKVLKDLVEHHAEEEEQEMLPRAKKLLGKQRLQELGEELQQRKDDLLGSEGRGVRTSARRVRR